MVEHTRAYAAISALAALLLLFGCAANAAGEQPEPPAAESMPLMSSAPQAIGGKEASAAPANEVRLTLIKFHGNSQCVSCVNLGKFANATLERNFHKELVEGTVKYLDINAQADPMDQYVQKYRPAYASLFLLTEGAGGEKYEELAEAWYYTGDEAKYSQYLTKLLRERLGG